MSLSDYVPSENEPIYDGSENSKYDTFCGEEEIPENLFGGWRFDNIEEAEELYYSYALKLGFKVRKQSMKYRPCGIVRYREWVCSCEGFKSCKEKPMQRGPKTETRCGCKARFRVAHDQKEQVYVVTDFVTEHNHDLDETRNLKRSRDNCEKQTTNAILNEFKQQQGKRIAAPPTLEDLLSFSSAGQHQNPTKPIDATSTNDMLNKPKPQGCQRTVTSPTLEDFMSTSSQGQHYPTKAREATTTNDILNKPKLHGGKRPVVTPTLKDFLSTSSPSSRQHQNPTKALDKGKGCCHTEKLILEIQALITEIQTLKSEIQSIKSDMPNIIEEKIRSHIPPIIKQYYNTNGTPSPAYYTNDSSPTNTKKRARTLNFEQANSHIPNFIDASNLEDEPVKVENNLWCNPEAADELIIRFLFDEKLDTCSTVVNFGRENLSRYDIKSLRPKNLVIDSVIDCVAYMASMKHKADSPERSSLFFSSRFADYVLQDKYGDTELVDWFLREDEELKVEKLEKLYIPINDTQCHWYLAIIDLDATTIRICDTRPTPMMIDFRKNQVSKMANKLGQLIEKGNIGNTFVYEYPKWVPLQTNVYDCGLYVCLMLLLREKMNKEFEKAESVTARLKLAIYLYTDPSNSVAWDRH